MMGCMVVKASMESFQEVQKQSEMPPASCARLRTSADSCQLMGSDMAANVVRGQPRRQLRRGKGRERGEG